MELPSLMSCGVKQTDKEANRKGARCQCRGPAAKPKNMVYRGQRYPPFLLVCGTRHPQIVHGPPNVQQRIEREGIRPRRCPHPQVHPTATVRPGRLWQGSCVPVQGECENAIRL